MASDETLITFNSSFHDEEDFSDDVYSSSFHHHHHHHHDNLHDHHHNHPHPHNLSRLSVCTSSTSCGLDDVVFDDIDNLMSTCVSRLSIESLEDPDGDADGEFSDGKEMNSSDSESEFGSSTCYSLPATPPRRRNRGHAAVVKDYASDNEDRKGTKKSDSRTRRRIRSVWGNSEKEKKEDQENLGFSGESDQSGGGGTAVMVITRPKGGKRTLCMDLEEVKACRDLGFELEHERMLEVPSRVSVSNSTFETSSGSNSPIANWRISGPGDDPREVKARLKVWAQAVALASASKYST